jgi:hypothetical protein
MFWVEAEHADVRDDREGVFRRLARGYWRRVRLTALRMARIEAVAVFVSMPTPHRTWSPVATST